MTKRPNTELIIAFFELEYLLEVATSLGSTLVVPLTVLSVFNSIDLCGFRHVTTFTFYLYRTKRNQGHLIPMVKRMFIKGML